MANLENPGLEATDPGLEATTDSHHDFPRIFGWQLLPPLCCMFLPTPPKKNRDPTYGDVSDVTNVIQEAVHFITQLITGDLRHGDLFAIGIWEVRSNCLARKFLMMIAVLLKLKQNALKERLNIWQSILITYIKLRSNVLFVWPVFYMVFTWLNRQKLLEKLGPIAKLGCDTPTLHSTEKLWMLFLNQWWSPTMFGAANASKQSIQLMRCKRHLSC